MIMSQTLELFGFLESAELAQYYDCLKEVLKITSVQHLKYAEEDDLSSIGMSRPEIRRLKKCYKRINPMGKFEKIRKILWKTNIENMPPTSSPALQRKSLQGKPSNRHIIPEDAITTSVVLGGGEFGTVEQGIWTSEDGEKIQVAIKSLSQKLMQAGMTDFLKEASIMHTIDHDHIVRLYGVVLGTETYMLVTELAPLRSLLECLKNEALRDTFPVSQLCDFAIEIADGMAYLENKRLIHRDLAARNILIFDKNTVKISDFGLSRALGVGSDYYQCNLDVNLKLPIAWCAPECINYLKFTSASDVWAYGVTLWECFSYGLQPWASFTGEQILAAVDMPEMKRLGIPEYCPVDIYNIMLKCWAHESEERPKFLDILHLLPQAKPEQVECVRESDSKSHTSDRLSYKVGDIVTVLDSRPSTLSTVGLWKGVNENGQKGYFPPGDTTPYIKIKTINSLSLTPSPRKVCRKDSNRKMQKPPLRKFNVEMIGAPQNDLRHTGHIGYDGAVFGDVSFIGGNYDKLPLKVAAIRPGEVSATQNEEFQSSRSSLNSLQDETWIEDDCDEFDNFKLPDLTNASDFGMSLMADIMKVFNEEKKELPLEVPLDLEGCEIAHTICVSKQFSSRLLEDAEQSCQLPVVPFMETEQNEATIPGQVNDDVTYNLSTNVSYLTSDETSHVCTSEDPHLIGHSHGKVIEPPFSYNMNSGMTMGEKNELHTNITVSKNIGTTTSGIASAHKLDPENTEQHFRMFADGSTDNISGHELEIQKIENDKGQQNLLQSNGSSYYQTTKGILDTKLINEQLDCLEEEEETKSMSKKDEKILKEAIALVEEFAQYNLNEQSSCQPVKSFPGEHVSHLITNKSHESASLQKMLSVKTGQKHDDQLLPSVSCSNVDLLLETTEACNQLVSGGPVPEEEDHGRSTEQNKYVTEEPASDVSKNGRVNLNIREPQGIPVRKYRSCYSPEEVETDTNPLRRLRESQGLIASQLKSTSRIQGDKSIKFTHGIKNHLDGRSGSNSNLQEQIEHK